MRQQSPENEGDTCTLCVIWSYLLLRSAADLQVVYPLLYNFVGSSKREETETEQAVSLVASRPSSHVVLKEALPGSEENVRRLVVQFQCKSEGRWSTRTSGQLDQCFSFLLFIYTNPSLDCKNSDSTKFDGTGDLLYTPARVYQ